MRFIVGVRWCCRRLTVRRKARHNHIDAQSSVVVCGGGPAGLTSALLLGRWGVPCILIEPLSQPSEHPRAHVLSARTMEIMREIGVEDEVAALSPPFDEWRHFRYCKSIDGSDNDLLGSADHGTRLAVANLAQSSPCGVKHVSQPKLEAVLRAKLADCTSVTTMYGARATSAELNAHGHWSVSLQGGDKIEGCRFLVGADGPRGIVRHAVVSETGRDETVAGVPVSPTGSSLQHFVSIHLESRELGQCLMEHPAMLYFVFNEAGARVIVAHDLQAGVFNLQVPFFPPLEQPVTDQAGVQRAIAACLADRKLPKDLIVRGLPRVWTMRARLESKWGRHGAFLVGDAAHELPPSGGFGLNAAVQDAHNLAWKLGRACNADDDSLLDTYEPERRPAVAAALAVAVDNWRRGLQVPAALGASQLALDRAKAAFSLGFLIGAPEATRSAFHAAAQLVYAVAFASASRTRLTKLLDTRAELPLFFPFIDLGVDYSIKCADKAARDALRNARHSDGAPLYLPRFSPGQRLPHYWLKTSTGRISSLDLVARAASRRPNYAILVLDGPADALANRTDPNKVAILDARPIDQGALVADLRAGDTTPPAAVLVRPDGIIARVWHEDLEEQFEQAGLLRPPP